MGRLILIHSNLLGFILPLLFYDVNTIFLKEYESKAKYQEVELPFNEPNEAEKAKLREAHIRQEASIDRSRHG
ncbi:hypothetical protein ASG93_09065 [Paenibacillus sp. Soil787]|nr:hypothetical protein [Paenibacillus sp. Soil787]KRF21509.1 hypothetical protein ASG93_09065 [Paenibacillus sp. Soil787]